MDAGSCPAQDHRRVGDRRTACPGPPPSGMVEVDTATSAAAPNEIDVIAILGAAGMSFAGLSEQIEGAVRRDAVAEAGLLTSAANWSAMLWG